VRRLLADQALPLRRLTEGEAMGTTTAPRKRHIEAVITTTDKEIDIWAGPSYTDDEIRQNVANAYGVKADEVRFKTPKNERKQS
jgi:hypothetical protein